MKSIGEAKSDITHRVRIHKKYDSYERIRQIREDKIHENNKRIGVTVFL